MQKPRQMMGDLRKNYGIFIMRTDDLHVFNRLWQENGSVGRKVFVMQMTVAQGKAQDAVRACPVWFGRLGVHAKRLRMHMLTLQVSTIYNPIIFAILLGI